MPLLLEGVVRFPVSYEPWYVYEATLVGSPTAYEFGDILIPDSAGLFDNSATTDEDFTLGYAIALEKFVTGDKTVQVAVPGSAIPFIADGAIRPTSQVKLVVVTTVQTVVPAVAAGVSLAAGQVLGRLRNNHEDHENLRITVADDVIIIMTGLA